MANLLWFFVSEDTLPLVIVVIGFGLMTGLLSRRTAFRTLGSVILLVLMLPFIPLLLEMLPLWLLVVLALFVAMSFLQAILSAAFGSGAANEAIGTLLADVIRFAVRMLFVPVRLGFGVIRALFGGRPV